MNAPKENASIVSAGANCLPGESKTMSSEDTFHNNADGQKKETKIAFSIFTSPKLLTKQIQIGEDGKLEKINPSSFVNLAEKKQCASLSEVMDVLDSLSDTQAAGWGIYALGSDCLPLATKGTATEGQATRSKEFFSWPNDAAVLMLDIDQPHDPLEA